MPSESVVSVFECLPFERPGHFACARNVERHVVETTSHLALVLFLSKSFVVPVSTMMMRVDLSCEEGSGPVACTKM